MRTSDFERQTTAHQGIKEVSEVNCAEIVKLRLTRRSEAGVVGELLLFSGILGDVHDLVLEDEKVRCTFACQADHILVVILDPSSDNLAIHQLDRNGLLLLAQRLQKIGLFERIFGRRRAPALWIWIAVSAPKRHAGIVHGTLC
jgi:hypothetical protein